MNNLVRNRWKIILLFLIVVIRPQVIFATHIKAADLFARVNPDNSNDLNAHRIIRFTLNVYCDKAKVEISSNSSQNFCEGRLANCATLDFGDGKSSLPTRYTSVTDVGNNTLLFVYYFTYTYGLDEYYEAGYYDENRNAGIKNLKQPSDLSAFFIKMGITIERGLGSNQTPQLSIPPVDLAETGRTFIHNPGAYDIDGDSIAYRPYRPQILPHIFDEAYRDPHLVRDGTNQAGNGGASYSINPYTGDVVWDAPVEVGLYNIAFIIEEWRIVGRRRELISFAVRDMQIEVRPGNNRQPIITVPQNVCIEPNTVYSTTITVNDPDGDRVTLIPYGELFDAGMPNKATLDGPLVAQPTPFSRAFRWNPTCINVRKRPYQAYFRATDVINFNPLTDIKSFFVTVVGPSPVNLKAQADTLNRNRVQLTWSKYPCVNPAQTMEIYRRVGCEPIQRRNCVLGKPSEDYVLIGTVNINDTSFVDSTVKKGNFYTYAIAAVFEDKFRQITHSYSSGAACAEIPANTPVITKVSFEGVSKNQILVQWIKPLDLENIEGPYQYKLYRRNSNEVQFTLLKTFPETTILTDTNYLDANITSKSTYYYFVEFLYRSKGNTVSLSDTSEIASSVFLRTIPIPSGIRLQWEATTPWANNIQNYPHYIYRKSPQDVGFVLIDSARFNQGVTTFVYDDKGKFQNQSFAFCDSFAYYVTTSGSYRNPKILEPISNNSFIQIGTPLVNIPPTAPVLADFTYDCQSFNQSYPYKNILNWSTSFSERCVQIVGYNIYFSQKKEDEDLTLLTTVDSLSHTYTHGNLNSVAGCYQVTAIDNVGNESVRSNKVCLDNCWLYELPNVFTPNNSGVNDLFRPLPPSPRFIESVRFSVFNRWGAKVFEKEDDIMLNWDGSGLPDGVYFYTAHVKVLSTEEKPLTHELKGWLQIIR